MPTVARAAKKPRAKAVKKPSLVSKYATQPTYSVRVKALDGAEVGEEIAVPVVQHNGKYAGVCTYKDLELKVGSILRINLNTDGEYDSTGLPGGYEEDGAFIPYGFIDDRRTYPFTLKGGGSGKGKPIKQYNLHYGPREYFNYGPYFEVINDSMLVE